MARQKITNKGRNIAANEWQEKALLCLTKTVQPKCTGSNKRQNRTVRKVI